MLFYWILTATVGYRHYYYSHFSDDKLRCRDLKVQGHTTGKWWSWDLNPDLSCAKSFCCEWMNKWLMGSWVWGEVLSFFTTSPVSWVLSSKHLQCLESASAHGKDSVKAPSLPVVILWPCLLFMGSSIFESAVLKIILNLLGALEDQPRHFRTAICLSTAQRIN